MVPVTWSQVEKGKPQYLGSKELGFTPTLWSWGHLAPTPHVACPYKWKNLYSHSAQGLLDQARALLQPSRVAPASPPPP